MNFHATATAMALPSWKHHGSRTNTDVTQLGPWLALGWMTIQGFDVDAVLVATNIVETGPPLYASGAKKERKKKRISMLQAHKVLWSIFGSWQ